MGYKHLGVLLSLLLVGLAQSSPVKPANSDEWISDMLDVDQEAALTAVTDGINKFAFNLLKTATELKGANKNTLVSPLSASLATAMVYQGAQGNTKAEIQTGLSFPQNEDQFEQGISILNAKLNEITNATLEIANKVFLEDTIAIRETFKKALKTVHNSSLESLDFVQSFEAARVHINDWVAQQTHDKIKDLLVEGSVDPSTVMVLVNALYFKGTWKNAFKPENTKELPFHLTTEQKVNVPMMHRKGHMDYAEVPQLKSKVLSLPYEGDEVRMVIILPDEIDGVNAVLEDLSSGKFNLDDVHFHNPEVRLWLPKFKIEDSHDLKAVYQKLGMPTMFDENRADFTAAIEPPPYVAISEAVQKTFMEVNEEGTEAAAATGFVASRCLSIPKPPTSFNVDRPFLVALQDTSADAILFAGLVATP